MPSALARSLHINHTGLVSGAEHSLLTLLGGLDPERVAGVACPEGPLADAVRAMGLRVVRIVGTKASFRLHPVYTPAALLEIVQSGLQLAAAARTTRADVVHANSVRSGLIAAVAARLGAPATVVHIRDVLPDAPSARLVQRIAIGNAAAAVCISRHVARTTIGALGTPLEVVPNAVDLAKFDPAVVDRRAARAKLELPETGLDFAMVGQITAWKGHEVAVRALALARRERPDLRLLIVGSVKFSASSSRHSNEEFFAALQTTIADLGVTEHVRFLGERDDVPRVLRACDGLLMPSVDEPFGRSVVEAMAMGTPVVATEVGGPAEIIEHNVTGLLANPVAPQAWADAILRIADRPDETLRRNDRAREVALRTYGQQQHAEHMGRLFDQVAAQNAR